MSGKIDLSPCANPQPALDRGKSNWSFLNLSGRSSEDGRARLAMVEPLLVVAAAPLLLFPRGYLPWAGLALLVVGWLWRGLGTGKWLIRTPLDYAMAAIVLATFMALLPSVDLALSTPKFYGIILGLFAYFATVTNVTNSRRYWLGVWLLVASILAISLVGLVGTEWNADKYPVLQRVYQMIPRLIRGIQASVGPSAGFHPNELGGTLAFLLPVPIALIIRLPLSRSERLMAGSAIVMGAGVLALTASRSAFMGIGVAVLGLLIWRWRRGGIAVLVIALVAVGLVFSFDSRAANDLLLRVDAISVSPGETTLISRLELWERARYMIEDFPFTGIGLNTFPVILNGLYPTFLSGPDLRIPHAHNIFLQTAIDLGIGGLLGFIGLWAGLAHCGWQAYTRAQPGEMIDETMSPERAGLRALQASIAGLLAGFASYLIYGLTDAITLGAKPLVLLWLMMGLVVAALSLGRSQEAGNGAAAVGRITPDGDGVVRQASAVSLRLAIGRDLYWIVAFLLVGLGYLVVGMGIWNKIL